MIDVQQINEQILAILFKHARLMSEFEHLTDDALTMRMNHLSTPCAYREANVLARLTNDAD